MKEIENNGIGITILTEEEIREGLTKEEDILRLDNFLVYIGDLDIYKLLKFTNHDINKIDLAYPIDWRYENKEIEERFTSGDSAYWSYENDHIFGTPLWRSDVLNELKDILYHKIKESE